MKFEINDRVRVKGTEKVGTVTAYKIDGYLLNGKKQEVTKYCLQVGSSYANDWFQEHLLEPFMSYDFDNEFEVGLIDFLINIYLLGKKIDLVKQLHNEKMKYM